MSTFIIFSTQGFPDVPSGHWAARSVNALKEEGLLKGYPGGSFNSPARPTLEERWNQFLAPLRSEGYLISYPEGLSHVSGFSRYEAAVQLHAIFEAAKSRLGLGRHRAGVIGWIDEFRDELTALGVDVPGLIREVRALANL